MTITNYPHEAVVLRGSAEPADAFSAALDLVGDTAVRVHGLEVTNANGTGVKVYDSSHVELDRLFVHGNASQGLLVTGGSSGLPLSYSVDVQVWNSTFSANGGAYPGDNSLAARGDHSIYYGTGVPGTTLATLGGVVANNVVYDQDYGASLQIGPEVDGLIVTNNTIYHSTSSDAYSGTGILPWNTSTDGSGTKNLVIVNNIIANCSGSPIYGYGASSMTTNLVDYNLSYANGKNPSAPSRGFDPRYGSIELYTLGTHNRTGQNPRFANAAEHDFHLRPGSPALGRADRPYAPPFDADGRPRAARPALGAFD